MADLSFTAGLDDSQFQRGLDRLNDSAERTGRTIGDALRFAVLYRGVKQSVAFASGALDEYARKNQVAAQAMRDHAGGIGRIKEAIGRDLSFWFRSSGDSIADWSEQMVRAVESTRTALVNFFADLMRWDWGNAAALDKVAEIERRQAQRAERIARTGDELFKIGQATERAGEDPRQRERNDVRRRLEADLRAYRQQGTAADLEKARRAQADAELEAVLRRERDARPTVRSLRSGLGGDRSLAEQVLGPGGLVTPTPGPSARERELIRQQEKAAKAAEQTSANTGRQVDLLSRIEQSLRRPAGVLA